MAPRGPMTKAAGVGEPGAAPEEVTATRRDDSTCERGAQATLGCHPRASNMSGPKLRHAPNGLSVGWLRLEEPETRPGQHRWQQPVEEDRWG